MSSPPVGGPGRSGPGRSGAAGSTEWVTGPAPGPVLGGGSSRIAPIRLAASSAIASSPAAMIRLDPAPPTTRSSSRAGMPELTGTATPPARSTPNSETQNIDEVGIRSATRCPGCSPPSISRAASALTAAFSRPQLSSRPPTGSIRASWAGSRRAASDTRSATLRPVLTGKSLTRTVDVAHHVRTVRSPGCAPRNVSPSYASARARRPLAHTIVTRRTREWLMPQPRWSPDFGADLRRRAAAQTARWHVCPGSVTPVTGPCRAGHLIA